MPELLSRAIEVVLDSKEYTSSAMLSFLEKLLNKGNNFSQLLSDSKSIVNIVKDIKARKSLILCCIPRKIFCHKIISVSVILKPS